MTEHDEDGYEGPATLRVEDTELAVDVVLAGNFEPIDGKYHWYGRILASAELTELVGARKAAASIRTPHGTAGRRRARGQRARGGGGGAGGAGGRGRAPPPRRGGGGGAAAGRGGGGGRAPAPPPPPAVSRADNP